MELDRGMVTGNFRNIIVSAALTLAASGCAPAFAQSVPLTMYPDYVLDEINMAQRFGRLNASDANYWRAEQHMFARRQAQLVRRRHGRLTGSDQAVMRSDWQSLYDQLKDAEGMPESTIGGGFKKAPLPAGYYE